MGTPNVSRPTAENSGPQRTKVPRSVLKLGAVPPTTSAARLLWLAPALVALAAHLSGLWSGFTNWDDPNYLINNPLTAEPLGAGWLELLLTPGLYYPIPVTVLGYALQRALFGLDPAMFHLVSIVLHAGVVTLVAALARRLGASALGATIAACVYAAHPLCVEPVAWVTGQKDLLCALFLLAALVTRAGDRGTGLSRATLAITFAALAMLSKPTGVCAPVLFIAVDWARGRTLRPQLLIYAALAALGLLVTGLSLWGHESVSAGPSNYFGVESVLRSAWTVKLQLTHTIVPYALAARYYAPGGYELALGAGAGLLVTIALVALFVRSARRRQVIAAAGILAALAAYAPTSGLLPLSRGAADSYMYLPLALAAAFAAVGIGRLAARSSRRVVAIAVVVCAIFGALSWSAHQHWRDATTLWYRVVDLNPHEPHAFWRLGNGFLFIKRPDLALETFELIESEHPDFIESRNVHGETLRLLGRIEEADRRLSGACEHGDLYYLERYGFFLINVDIEPFDRETARTALLLTAPLLATRGKRPESLIRGISLLRGYGDDAAAALLERRLLEITDR